MSLEQKQTLKNGEDWMKRWDLSLERKPVWKLECEVWN